MDTKTNKNKHLNNSEYLQNNLEEPEISTHPIVELNKTLEASKKMVQMVKGFPNLMKSSGSALGMKQQLFIKKIFEFAKEDPQLLPHEFEAEILDSIIEQTQSLIKIRQNVDQVQKKVNAKLHQLVGQERQIASQIYGLIRSFAAADVPGMQDLYDQLKVNYQKNKKKPENTAPKTIVSGYEEKNGDFLMMEKKTQRGVRIRKSKTPLDIFQHKDKKNEKG